MSGGGAVSQSIIIYNDQHPGGRAETCIAENECSNIHTHSILTRHLSCLHMLSRWFVILIASCFCNFSHAQPKENRVALVVGNGAYKYSPLKNPTNDARDMAIKLKGLGFNVVERSNLSVKQIGSTLREFRSKLTPGSVALVFYAGHGLQIKGENYLPAVDADINGEEDVPNQSLAMRQIMDVLGDAKTRLNLVFLDACRNNPYARSFRSAGDGLSKVNAPSGTLISFATRPGSVALDGSGRNGLYTSALLEQMNYQSQPIEQVLKKVVSQVKAGSNSQQEPWMEGSIEGEFCFGECGKQPALTAVSDERALWESVKDSRDINDLTAYLNKFPFGLFAEIANNRISALRKTPPAQTVLNGAASNNSVESFNVVRIGHAGPTSGPIAHLGRDNENGAILAVEEINAKGIKINGKVVKFELLREDDAGNPRQSTFVAQKLIDAKVSGVIGHLNSGTSIPASKLYSDAGIPQISPSATNPKYTRNGYNTTFRIVADDAHLGNTLGRYAVKNLNGRSIAVIDDRTAYGAGVAAEFENGVRDAGANIVGHEYTSDKATDLTSVLMSLKRQNPDVIFFGGMDAVAGPMIRQMKSLGINAILMGGDGICTGELTKLASDAITDIRVFCAEAGGVESHLVKGMQDFYSKYKRRFGIDVQVYAPYVYDAMHVLVDAMIRADSVEPNRYLQTLKQNNAYQGITGPISFDYKGDIKNGALTLYTYKYGRRSQVSVMR